MASEDEMNSTGVRLPAQAPSIYSAERDRRREASNYFVIRSAPIRSAIRYNYRSMRTRGVSAWYARFLTWNLLFAVDTFGGSSMRFGSIVPPADELTPDELHAAMVEGEPIWNAGAAL